MSGIIGIHREASSAPNERDGLQAQEVQVLVPSLQQSLGRMADTLAHRGPDGRSLWVEKSSQPNVGLGHLALHTTPEAHSESLPLRCERHDLVLTSDARLDNREELLVALRPQLEQILGPAPEQALIGDSLLILAAYVRWKNGCAQHLLGDFAFAIWDGRAQELFCARDHAGVKPFYYFHNPDGGSLFAFASEIKALFEVPSVPRIVDEARIAKYLLIAFDSFEDTAFEGIRRLPPAHTLRLSSRGLEIERYWDLKSVPMLRGLSDRDYEKRFREVLFEAVRCRMRASQQKAGEKSTVGGFLSGGLDSSAVVCVARHIESEKSEPAALPVFSAIFEAVPQCDERPFIQAVLDGGGLSPHWIKGEGRCPLTNLEQVLAHTDEPILGPNLCSSWTHYKPVRQAGVRVLLDGHGGDETVGYGLPLLSEMVLEGRWRALWCELRLLERNGFLEGGANARELMRRSLAHSLKPLRLARRIGHGLARRLPGFSAARTRRGQNVARGEESGSGKPLWKALLRDDFAARIGAEAMHRKAQASEPRNTDGDRKYNESTLSAPLQALAFEELSKAAAAGGVEARYPLWDKRLVELCLSLPPEQKLREGWTRSILRRSLEGVLPREVQWRGSKVDFTPEAWHGLRALEASRLQKLADQELPWSQRFTDSDEASRCARLMLENEAPVSGPLPLVIRASALESWLQIQGEASGEAHGKTHGETEASHTQHLSEPMLEPDLEREAVELVSRE